MALLHQEPKTTYSQLKLMAIFPTDFSGPSEWMCEVGEIWIFSRNGATAKRLSGLHDCMGKYFWADPVVQTHVLV